MACECTINEYVRMYPDYRSKIIAINALIDKMLESMLDQTAGTSTGVSEYQLDDGQVKIKTGYMSMTQVTSGIEALEKMKQVYINRMNGRTFILQDVKSFRRR